MSDIRSAFVSRFGEDGWLLEADFSQLEVVVLAFLSQDPQLIYDVTHGVDIHAINAANLFGKGFTEKQRKIAKRLSFQLQYGAGAKSMAKKNKIPLDTAKQFIENYYRRYPVVKEWQDKIKEQVEASRQLSDKRTANGLPAGMGNYDSLTGRRYVFYEYDALEWFRDKTGQTTAFSPTETKNYPVQGFATGDIVPLVLGKLYRKIKEVEEWDDKVKLIMTVHDSILLDTHWTVRDECAIMVKETMEKASEYLKEELGIDFDIPLKAEVKAGRNWLNMETLKI